MDDAPTDEHTARDGLSPEDAFSALGNEIRLTILQALWEAPDECVPFSDLRERVGVADPGRLNYHLTRLTDHFIRRTEDGYELRYAGERILRAVRAGVITEDPVIEPTEVDDTCPYCGATVEMRYEDDRLTVRCTECAGLVGGAFPPGTYMSYDFPPAGLDNRTPEEVLRAAHTYYDSRITPMMDGVCPECAGTTTLSIDICEYHEEEEGRICKHCHSTNRIWAEYVCEHCGYTRRCLIWFKLMTHPAVISFYHEHGDIQESIPFRKLTEENPPYIGNITETIVSEDPLRIRVTIPIADQKLYVTVDDALNVVDVAH